MSNSLDIEVLSTSYTRMSRVSQETFDVYLDACSYLSTYLIAEVLTAMSAPLDAMTACSLQSVSILSDGRRRYIWNVTATWTE